MKNPLICVAGPTASGKTALAVLLAKTLGGEVVSADSMQLYQGMDIGTAKPTIEERQGVPHHLIDVISPFSSFSVKDYGELAKETIGNIHSRNKVPILAGGTGLFIQAVIDNLQFSPGKTDEALRKKLEKQAKEEGNEVIHRRLAKIDPKSAKRLHPNNLRRVIRAIELYETTGITMTKQLKESKREPSPYALSYFGLNQERAKLYERINLRVDEMLLAGLLSEVRSLKEQGLTRSHKSMQGIGYKELYAHLEGNCTLEEAAENIKLETRRYAKRQLTWFRKDSRIHWMDIEDYPTPKEQLTYLKKENLL